MEICTMLRLFIIESADDALCINNFAMYREYTISDIKRIISEALSENSGKNEFKPVLGKGVTSGNKKNSEGAYDNLNNVKGAAKIRHDVSWGKSNGKSIEGSMKHHENKGMSDLYVNNADKTYSDRVKAQMNGYTSVQNEKVSKSAEYGNDKYGNADYGDGEISDALRKKAKQSKDKKVDTETSGLTARTMPRKDFEEQNKTIFGEQKDDSLDDYMRQVDALFEDKRMKRVVFKNTKFLSEAHMYEMVKRVPDTLKEEGNRFVMRDCDGYEYLIEWHQTKPIAEKRVNKKEVEDEFNRIREMFSYKSKGNLKENKMSGAQRVAEEKKVGDMLSKIRGLMKD